MTCRLSNSDGSLYGVLAHDMSPVTRVSTPAPSIGSSGGGGSPLLRLASSEIFRRQVKVMPCETT